MNIRAALFRSDPSMDVTLVHNEERLAEELATRTAPNRSSRLIQQTDSNGMTYLHHAAKNGALGSVGVLLQAGADPNVRSGKLSGEMTAVHFAAKYGQHTVLGQLLEYPKSDIYQRDLMGKTPLDYAIKSLDPALEAKLGEIWEKKTLEQKQDMEVAEDSLRTGQPLATGREDATVRSKVKVQGADGTILELRSEIMLNSLQLAKALRSTYEVSAVLMECTAVHLACQFGCHRVVQHLLQKAPTLLNHASMVGYTPLHMLAIYNQVEVLQLIIDLVKRQEVQTRSPAPNDVTVEANHSELDAMYKPDFSATTETGHTPLHLAAILGHAEFVQILVANARSMGVPLNEGDSLSLTPLHSALSCMPSNNSNTWCSIVECLLKGGAKADTQIRNPDNVHVFATPLAQACAGGHFEQVHQLLHFGAKDTKHDALNLCLQQDNNPVLVELLSHLISCNDGQYSILWNNCAFSGTINPSWMADALIRCWTRMKQQEGAFISVGVAYELEMAVTKVDLSNCGLRCLPIEVFQFPNLEVLAADSNELSCLPLEPSHIATTATDEYQREPALAQSGWRCLNLQHLSLKQNRLSLLPQCLFQLPLLMFLDVSHNQLTMLPDNIWIAPQLQRCVCSNNRLASLPSNQSLHLNQAVITSQTGEVVNMQSAFPRLPSFIAGSTTYQMQTAKEKQINIRSSQRYLDVTISRGWGANGQGHTHQSLPTSHSPPDDLQERLVKLHPFIIFKASQQEARSSEYLGIRFLNLANNCLTYLPPDLPCLCPNLKDLDVSNNQLSFVNLPYGLPCTLGSLTLNGNKLTHLACCKVTPELHFCTMPHSVDQSGESEARKPDGPSYCRKHSKSKLQWLTSFKVKSCDLVQLDLCCPQEVEPADHSHSHSGSQQAAAGSVQKGDKILSEASEPQLVSADVVCPALQYLHLSGNQLSEVPASVLSLTQLVSLHLSHNSGIIHLPRELGGLRKLREVHVEGLSLIFPPMELLGQGSVSHDIITYLQFLRQQNRPYQCIKLMVVGREGRGKTTLLGRLMERGQQTENRSLFSRRHRSSRTQLTTVGISLRDWVYRRTSNVIEDIRTITYRTWDFAGQGDFYSTHQIFLSGTAVFLAVWNVTQRRKGAAELEKWLRNIHARVAHPAVIIVGTHYDLLSSREDHEFLDMQLTELANKYRIPDYQPGILQRWKGPPADGYPPVLASVVVSSSSGKNIALLRDRIYEVSCSLKGGHTGGHGSLPGTDNVNRNRYVLCQFHPASYLWLEDLVRSLTANYRQRRAPPVLTSREFKEAVFSNRGNMFLGDSAERDLGQAVKFLCANGTLFHQEDPVLANLYFIDPQWLVDLFAHVVTIKNINFCVSRETGVMQKCDLDRVFQNQDEFPMHWKKEYIRLMTMFEVIVEIDADQILIPSHLPSKVMADPFLMGSEFMNCLPPLLHLFVMPYIPSGLWTRLIARVLGDTLLMDLVVTCFKHKTPAIKSFFDVGQPFSWDLAQEGLMLKYGPYPVLTIREIPQGRLFQDSSCSKVHHIVSGSQEWKSMSNQDHHGLQVVVNDLFPLLALEEAAEVYHHFGLDGLSLLPFVQFDSSRPLETSVMSFLGMSVSEGTVEEEGSDTPTGSLRLPPLSYLNGQEAPAEVKVVKTRETLGRTINIGSGMGRAATESGSDKVSPFQRPRSRVVSSPIVSRHSVIVNRTERGQSSPTMAAWSSHQPGFSSKPTWEGPTSDTLRTLEEHYDTHRAAILSRVLGNIRSVLEDWYPRLMASSFRHDAECIPCPFCWTGLAHVQQNFKRTFSACKDLQDEVKLLVRPDAECKLESPPFVPPSDERPDATGLPECIVGQSPPSWECRNFYLFKFSHLLDNAAESLLAFCPNHHTLPAKYIAPDLVFQSLGPDMVIPYTELEEVSVLGQGQFATVHRMKWHHQDGHRMLTTEVALKKVKNTQDRATQHLALEKELTLLTSLAHPNVLRCLGVVLQPLGAVLELATEGSLRTTYLEYVRVGQVIPAPIIHKTLLDITNGLDYLHRRGIIYHDLKCDNVLVWRYLFPGPQASYQDDYVLGDDAVLVKLADFNISAVIPTVSIINQPRGTLGYMAPELFNYKYGLYTNKVDLYSLGSVMYELISLQMPFESQRTLQLMSKASRPPLPSKSRVLPILLLELMAWCWEENPELRPSVCQVLDALKMPEYLRLRTALDLHSKLHPKCLTVWKGDPCNQQDARPQSNIEDSGPSQECHTHSPDACQLWVACADLHTSSLVVWDFSDGQITAVQDISGGASSVLCVLSVRDTVWVGFEHGYIMVYSARSKQPSLQLWPHGRCQSVQCMAYIPNLQTVYLGFQNGIVWAVPENVVAMETVGMVTRSLPTPKVIFHDYNKTIAAILPVASSNPNSQGYELWVGQSQKTIAIIDASTLQPIKYLCNEHDNSMLPRYLSDSYISHFAIDKQLTREAHIQERNSFLYSALFSGQVVTMWCPVTKKHKATYNVTKCMGKECWITALHVSRQNICVGLTNGKILILQSVIGAMSPLTTLSCHQQQVSCLTTLPSDHADRPGHSRYNLSRQTTHPHPIRLQLVSCGLGFHSYPTPSSSEQSSIPHPNALPPAKLLIWDLTGLQ